MNWDVSSCIHTASLSCLWLETCLKCMDPLSCPCIQACNAKNMSLLGTMCMTHASGMLCNMSHCSLSIHGAALIDACGHRIRARAPPKQTIDHQHTCNPQSRLRLVAGRHEGCWMPVCASASLVLPGVSAWHRHLSAGHQPGSWAVLIHCSDEMCFVVMCLVLHHRWSYQQAAAESAVRCQPAPALLASTCVPSMCRTPAAECCSCNQVFRC